MKALSLLNTYGNQPSKLLDEKKKKQAGSYLFSGSATSSAENSELSNNQYCHIQLKENIRRVHELHEGT